MASDELERFRGWPAAVVARFAALLESGPVGRRDVARVLDEAVAQGELSAREAYAILFPRGFAGLCAGDAMSSAEAERGDALLLAACELRGFAAMVDGLEADVDDELLRFERFDPTAPMRWAGGRCRMRLIPRDAYPVVQDYVAWCVPGSRGLAICADFVEPGDALAMERMLRGALEKYRGQRAAPVGGLVSDDALLLAVAERVVGGEHPVVHEETPVFHVHAIDTRARLAFEVRDPRWWVQPSAASTRFLTAAASLLRAEPWRLPSRTQIQIRSEAWRFTMVFTQNDPEVRFADGREAVFVIAHDEDTPQSDAPVGADLVVVAMAEEPDLAGDLAVVGRALLAKQGWTDRHRWPHVVVCRDGDVGRLPAELDFELAYVGSESLARAIPEIVKERHGRIERVYCFPEVDTTVTMTALWWTG